MTEEMTVTIWLAPDRPVRDAARCTRGSLGDLDSGKEETMKACFAIAAPGEVAAR